MTTSRSSLEDICQLYDVQKEFGEQDEQAPIVEEVKEFGQIGIHSLLDHEMTDTSPIEDMPYLQSQMHFDESIEIIAADSDLEDGELQKLLTSQLYAQRASGRPDAMIVQEREVSAQTSHRSQDQRASGRRAASFSPKRNEQRNKMWSSLFGNANVSNMSETLLEGNKDHLLNRARTDRARREIHVGSLNKCINMIYKKQTYTTNLSNLVEKQTRLQEEFLRKEKALRDTQT